MVFLALLCTILFSYTHLLQGTKPFIIFRQGLFASLPYNTGGTSLWIDSLNTVRISTNNAAMVILGYPTFIYTVAAATGHQHLILSGLKFQPLVKGVMLLLPSHLWPYESFVLLHQHFSYY